MAFSPPVAGCLVKKGLKKGGHGHPRSPPGYAYVINVDVDELMEKLQLLENVDLNCLPMEEWSLKWWIIKTQLMIKQRTIKIRL